VDSFLLRFNLDSFWAYRLAIIMPTIATGDTSSRSRASLEILDGALVLLSGRARIERAKVSPTIRSRVDLARIQSILAGIEFAYHAAQPYNYHP
jgi:hypothetical protein